MRMTRAQWDELIEHAREEYPKECCGFVRVSEGSVQGVHRGINDRASMYGYQLDSKSHFEAYKAQDEGFTIGMYHSHPKSSAKPSQTDINLVNDPDFIYLIVSLDGDPHVRAWKIADGRVDEEPIEIDG